MMVVRENFFSETFYRIVICGRRGKIYSEYTFGQTRDLIPYLCTHKVGKRAPEIRNTRFNLRPNWLRRQYHVLRIQMYVFIIVYDLNSEND